MATNTSKPRSSNLLGKRKVTSEAMKKAVKEVVLSHYGSVAAAGMIATQRISTKENLVKPSVSRTATAKKAFVAKKG